MGERIIECVPNFSEGRDLAVIDRIAREVRSIPEVKLLEVDPGKGANRTVFTFVGSPEAVTEAAFAAIRKAAEWIDMRIHQGVHPRIGATDVCPLIPVSGISVEETVIYAKQLAARVAGELGIPVYLYEHAASTPERKNLAQIRACGYEGLENRLKDPAWKPDYGDTSFNQVSGATVIGVRDLLVAYNVNLNTDSVQEAFRIAREIREKGRIEKVNGQPLLDDQGNPQYVPGSLKSVKAIGWFIEEYGIAQVSMNLTNLADTPVHEAFEACRRSAEKRGLRITGSELVGLIPLKALTDAGKYFISKNGEEGDFTDQELVTRAVKFLGLDDLKPFDPFKKVIEYLMADHAGSEARG